MTKKQARLHKASWVKALSEHRVVKIGETTFREFATNAIARDALVMIRTIDPQAHIVGESE